MAFAASARCAVVVQEAASTAGPAARRSAVGSASTSLAGARLSAAGLCSARSAARLSTPRRAPATSATAAGLVGAELTVDDSAYFVVGVGHCFQSKNGKIVDDFVIEPIPAGALEAMNNGAKTCYKMATAVTFGQVKSQDISKLPAEFKASGARFADEWIFRCQCTARTWTRSHAMEHLTKLVPSGAVRKDFNFNVDSKRVLNAEHDVKDSDNIKQDMSIDVYGRKDDEAVQTDIEKGYNA